MSCINKFKTTQINVYANANTIKTTQINGYANANTIKTTQTTHTA